MLYILFFLISSGLIFILYNLRKIRNLPDAEFEKYFLKRFRYIIKEDTFEIKLKKFRFINLFLYWLIVIILMVFTIFVFIKYW